LVITWLNDLMSTYSKSKYHTSVPLLNELEPRDKAHFAKERHAEREIFLSLLQNSSSKRTANAYLSRFALSKKHEPIASPKVEKVVKEVVGQENFDLWRLSKTGVNLGNLYNPGKAIEDSPVFAQQPLPNQLLPENVETIHIALVKLREPQNIDDPILDGVATTLGQLVRLGLNIVIVSDCDGQTLDRSSDIASRNWQEEVYFQASRVVNALNKHNKSGAIRIADALERVELEDEVASTVFVRGRIEVGMRNLLLPLLSAGIIPVVPATAVASETHTRIRVDADDIVLALARDLSGIKSQIIDGKEPSEVTESLTKAAKSLEDKTSLDKIVVMDPLGGIPSDETPHRSHVFINLENEYKSIQNELTRSSGKLETVTTKEKQSNHAVVEGSNQSIKLIEENVNSGLGGVRTDKHSMYSPEQSARRHLKNLDLVQRTLQLLPPSSSALIITPKAAAISSQDPEPPPSVSGVRSRRKKNPLIHNLLTDKSMISSSLPISRLSGSQAAGSSANSENAIFNDATLVKKGISLTMIPNPHTHPWTPPGPEGTTMSLTDPNIDFPRLLHLIEDSFGRKLDVNHYLNRIRNRLAGIIIAGEYEGGAILTWETPPHYPKSPPVPYLDKFAVLRRAQGTGGVADIVFKAMLRSCFPGGCVWRSRTTNPVNKWYLERSEGSWKLPGGQWTMFWSVEKGHGMDDIVGYQGTREDRWRDWVDVCQNVVPSWKDDKAPD
jgi:amino-acid N-acetyltransferase